MQTQHAKLETEINNVSTPKIITHFMMISFTVNNNFTVTKDHSSEVALEQLLNVLFCKTRPCCGNDVPCTRASVWR